MKTFSFDKQLQTKKMERAYLARFMNRDQVILTDIEKVENLRNSIGKRKVFNSDSLFLQCFQRSDK